MNNYNKIKQHVRTFFESNKNTANSSNLRKDTDTITETKTKTAIDASCISPTTATPRLINGGTHHTPINTPHNTSNNICLTQAVKYKGPGIISRADSAVYLTLLGAMGACTAALGSILISLASPVAAIMFLPTIGSLSAIPISIRNTQTVPHSLNRFEQDIKAHLPAVSAQLKHVVQHQKSLSIDDPTCAMLQKKLQELDTLSESLKAFQSTQSASKKKSTGIMRDNYTPYKALKDISTSLNRIKKETAIYLEAGNELTYHAPSTV